MNYRGTVITVYSSDTPYLGPGFKISNGNKEFYVATSTYGVAFGPNAIDAKNSMQEMIDRTLDAK